MASWYDTRKMVPRWGLGGALASDLDRLAGFPDIRIQRVAGSVSIQWRFIGDEDPQALPEGWTWGIERSGSPGGPFTILVEALPDTVRFYRDDQMLSAREETRFVYYRLFIDPPGQERLTFGYRPEWDRTAEGEELHGQTWEEKGVRTAYIPGPIREIRQRIQNVISNYAGTKCLLYREAWMEGPCPECKNPLTGTVRSGMGGDFCRSCYGTHFLSGFYQPLLTTFYQTGSTIQLSQMPHGVRDQTEAAKLLLPHWPIVEPRDLLRTDSGTIWLVGNEITPATLYGYPTLMMVTATQVARTHPLQNIPYPERYTLISSGPRRQHGRAMTRESYASSLAEGGMNRAQFETLQGWTRDD